MYKAFYGLSDNPFSIAPNPHYLFLSDRHREALAHLTYGLGETGGFVLLTGEVGTGKTTVSRCLLGQLPDNTDTAFILNPSLTELELLATLCDELKISYGDNPTLKQLTDHLSRFLLANHSKGRNTVLIIDEAQHLRPEVLEQLRLLTNLETDTKKLLQVILIGQPELQLLLKRQELRQLAQRITARYHLLPLNEDEIALYVLHRLQVAGRFEPLFTRKAVNVLQKYSGGIPRLINLLCERSLMAGYAQSRVPIDHHMVRQAAAEVLGEEEPTQNRYLWPTATAAALCVAFGVSYWLFTDKSVNTVPASNLVSESVPTNVASLNAQTLG
nr:AAA family ATPase [Shewanella sp.]